MHSSRGVDHNILPGSHVGRRNAPNTPVAAKPMAAVSVMDDATTYHTALPILHMGRCNALSTPVAAIPIAALSAVDHYALPCSHVDRRKTPSTLVVAKPIGALSAMDYNFLPNLQVGRLMMCPLRSRRSETCCGPDCHGSLCSTGFACKSAQLPWHSSRGETYRCPGCYGLMSPLIILLYLVSKWVGAMPLALQSQRHLLLP